MSKIHPFIGLLILSFTTSAQASPDTVTPPIEAVCQHSMAQALKTHEDQFSGRDLE